MQRELIRLSRDNLDYHKKKMTKRKMKISMLRSSRVVTMKKKTMMMRMMKISRKILKRNEKLILKAVKI